MNHKRAGEIKPCKSPQSQENSNMFNPHGDSDIDFSKKDVPSSHHVGSMMISSENGASSSSSHPQPINLPDFLDKEAIGEDLLSQSLLDSVLKCTRLAVGSRKRQKAAHILVPREIVTSQLSHSQAGKAKEDATFVKVKPCVCPNGPCRYVKVLNCMIPVALEESGERCQVCNDKHLKRPSGNAPSQETLYVKAHLTKDERPRNEKKLYGKTHTTKDGHLRNEEAVFTRVLKDSLSVDINRLYL